MSESQISRRDVERLFLQAVLSRGILSKTVAKLLHKKCISAVTLCGDVQMRYDESEKYWDDFMTSLSGSLNKLDLEFRGTQDENTGKYFYGIVNRKDDEIAQLATDYTPAEISFFKGVVEQIMLAPHESYSVSSLAALREISALKLNMTKAQGEILLTSFVAKGWLTKSKRGRYALAVRSTLELYPYLKSTYPDEYLECTACLEVLTHGVACATPNCKARLHHHCYTRYSKRKNQECPTCKANWPASAKDLVPIGEEAARDLDDNRRRTRQTSTDSDEEDAEFSEGEEEAPSQTQTQAKGKGKGKGKQKQKARAVTASDEDVDMEDEDEDPSQQPRRSSRRH